jgi:hypothetical protein
MKKQNFFKNPTSNGEGDATFAYMKGLNIIDSTDNLLQYESCVKYIELFERMFPKENKLNQRLLNLLRKRWPPLT